jgi:signal transduction histidine kinase
MPRLAEDKRIAALESYEILDTLPEPAFDELTTLASQLTEAPISLISLIDRERQWFKSCIGLDTHETPRAMAFCAYAIEQAEPLVVHDARKDPRFANNPLVTGAPGIQFYAGFPLIDEQGAALGTLCVIDTKPRTLTALQMTSMRIVANQVVAQLHLRRLTRVLRDELSRSSFMAEAGRLLGASLDTDATLHAVANLAVPRIADACSIVVLEGGELRRVAETAIDPEITDVVRDLREHPINKDSVLPMREVLEKKTALLFADYPRWLAERLPPENIYRQRVEKIGVRSAISAPMMIGERVLGMLSVAVLEKTGRRYIQHDVDTIRELAQRAALALENARLFGEANEANRTKDMFLAAISHDLRTPLSAILGWTQVLRRKPDDRATVVRAVDVIERSAGAQARFIEDLLDITRIATGRLHIEREPIDLIEVVGHALDDVRPSMEAKRLTLDVALDQAARHAIGDAGRLQQVVWNLMNNAIKFSAPETRIEVRLSREGERGKLVVRDFGRGIAPDLLPHVFERFRQDGDGVGRRLGGLGLGLSIAKHIVEEIGGSIRAESGGSGMGACFTVTLPLKDEVARTAAQR